ncbi:hypothetical protein QOM21_23365 [Streptomyces sp. Pv4-95]|uniref:hypothetical protein n=1 Tax=Streptomyces sp. Pv4-95 TaxID=3049543 RepID=UPI0038912FA0
MHEEGFSVWETGVSRGVKGSAARGAGRTGHTVAGGAPAIAAAPGHHPLRERTALPDPAQPCDLVTVPARQGLEAVDILRLRDGVGPVLHDGACHTLGFLVPPGTADGWDVPGSACTQTHGRGLALSAAHGEEGAVIEPPVTGTGWLVPPEGAFAAATDPTVLREALGQAARTIEAVDRCQ